MGVLPVPQPVTKYSQSVGQSMSTKTHFVPKNDTGERWAQQNKQVEITLKLKIFIILSFSLPLSLFGFLFVLFETIFFFQYFFSPPSPGIQYQR